MNEHKMQFIAIFLMSFLTLWIFSGVGAEVAGIQQTVNEFYDETDMADMWVYSENLGNDSINQIKEISTTEDFERQLILRSTANISGNPTLTLHFIEKNKLSKYYPVDGDKFNMDDEEGIWLDKRFADAHNLKVGDKVKVEFNGLSIEKTIKGLGYSPEYVYVQGDSLIPDFKLQGFAYLSHKAFPIENVPYNVILIKSMILIINQNWMIKLIMIH